MARVQVSYKTIGDAMRSPKVREALRKKAEQKQATAESIAASEGVEINSRVVDGTRPKGRPYSRVESPNVDQEWGNNHTARRRILGRAAES